MASSSTLAQLSKTSIRLYRVLIRECRLAVSSGDHTIFLQRPLNPRDWGLARLFTCQNLLIQEHRSDGENCEHIRRKGFVYEPNEILKFVDNYLQYESVLLASTMSSPSSMWSSLDSFFVTTDTLTQTVRFAFRSSSVTPETTASSDQIKSDILRMHRRAIDAMRLLRVQLSLRDTTSVYYNPIHHVRVVATSTCVGRVATTTSMSMKQPEQHGPKYRFAYRIRVENCNDPVTTHTSVQLLGRSWNISEVGGDTFNVHAPTTGAVGHMPVIQPGQVFEYMSGVDLETTTGSMSGHFHMAIVDKESESMLVEEQKFAEDKFSDEKLFQLDVAPFALIATESQN